MKEHDPAGNRLPIKIDSASNGEHPPIPLCVEEIAANRLAHEYAGRYSRKLGGSAARIHSIDLDVFARKRQVDEMGHKKKHYSRSPNPSFQTYGPKTTEQFKELWQKRGGRPG